jgi:hypothetical protein
MKTKITLVLMFAIASIIGNAQTTTNVALGKTATVSEIYTGGAYPGSKALDGDKTSSSSRWMTNGTLPGWIEVDLGGTYTISSYTFYAQATFFLNTFKFQYWNGYAWVDLDSKTGNAADTYTNTFTPVTVNKVRFYVTAVSSGTMVRLYELEIYGFAATNVALNKTATASSFYDNPNHTANFAVDGDRTTSASRWMSDGTFPQTLEINLNGYYDINAFAFWNGNYGSGLTQFKFQYWDGTAWVDLISETGTTDYFSYNKTFTSVSTNKVRLYVTGATMAGSPVMRLYEIEVYGSVATATSINPLKSDASTILSIFPNPLRSSNSDLVLPSYNFINSESVKLSVLDLTGKIVYKKNIATQNAKDFIIPGTVFSKGIYLVKVVDNVNITKVSKLIVE